MPDKPTMAEVLREALDARLRSVHTALPGKVKKYDAATQTADVIPVVQAATPRADGSLALEDLPVIPNVRVLWPRAGGVSLHLPMAAGDYVLLVFNEAALGHWRDTGQVPSPPGDLTRHSLSYPYALPGGWPDAGALPSDARPASGEAVLAVGSNVFRVGGASAELVALANLVNENFQAIVDLFSSWTPVPNDGGAALKTASGSLAFADVAATKLKAE